VKPARLLRRGIPPPKLETVFARKRPGFNRRGIFLPRPCAGRGCGISRTCRQPITNKKSAEQTLDAYRRLGSMNSILNRAPARAGSTPPRDRPANLSPEAALAIARDRFYNLCSTGILGRKFAGPLVDLADLDKALAFLRQCRKTKKPNTHSADLACEIGVSVGAVIAAATALNFTVQSWMFVPNAMIGVNRVDVRKHATRR
jgi:hypothetical protein